MAPSEPTLPFIRNLASSDRKLRTQSLTSLRTFLSTRTALSQTDALKIWKGLFYALYMTDRPLPQQALAADLANLLNDALPADDGGTVGVVWMGAFWRVLGEEWTGIDALRMDKFMGLVRRMFAAQLRWALTSEGEERGKGRVGLLAGVLREWCFDPECDLRRVPVGLRLHVLDLWVDELERENVITPPPSPGQTEPKQAEAAGDKAELVAQIGKIIDELRACPVKPVRDRARMSYDDERLPWAVKTASDDAEDRDEGSEDGWGGIED